MSKTKPMFHNPARIHKSKEYILPDWTGIAALMLIAGIAVGMLLGLGVARAEKARTMYVNTQTTPLNVREKPNLHAEIVGRLERGEAVTVTRIENGWALVVDGWEAGEGWASMKYLSDKPVDVPVEQQELPARLFEVEDDE